MHVYGLTETYGHMYCSVHGMKNGMILKKIRRMKLKQDKELDILILKVPVVMDPETMKPVPKDGKTMGEIMIRGNVVMKGYYKDKEATDKAMAGGWFHSGDLAVTHPDGYIKDTR